MDLPRVAGGFARCRDPVIKTLPNIADDEHLPPSEIAYAFQKLLALSLTFVLASGSQVARAR
jgi:hypothetical protein